MSSLDIRPREHPHLRASFSYLSVLAEMWCAHSLFQTNNPWWAFFFVAFAFLTLCGHMNSFEPTKWRQSLLRSHISCLSALAEVWCAVSLLQAESPWWAFLFTGSAFLTVHYRVFDRDRSPSVTSKLEQMARVYIRIFVSGPIGLVLWYGVDLSMGLFVGRLPQGFAGDTLTLLVAWQPTFTTHYDLMPNCDECVTALEYNGYAELALETIDIFSATRFVSNRERVMPLFSPIVTLVFLTRAFLVVFGAIIVLNENHDLLLQSCLTLGASVEPAIKGFYEANVPVAPRTGNLFYDIVVGLLFVIAIALVLIVLVAAMILGTFGMAFIYLLVYLRVPDMLLATIALLLLIKALLATTQLVKALFDPIEQ